MECSEFFSSPFNCTNKWKIRAEPRVAHLYVQNSMRIPHEHRSAIRVSSVSIPIQFYCLPYTINKFFMDSDMRRQTELRSLNISVPVVLRKVRCDCSYIVVIFSIVELKTHLNSNYAPTLFNISYFFY